MPLTSTQVRAMTDDQIISHLERAALFQREHKAVTYDHGLDLVNIVAIHGDKLARALFVWDEPRSIAEAITGGGFDPYNPRQRKDDP